MERDGGRGRGNRVEVLQGETELTLSFALSSTSSSYSSNLPKPSASPPGGKSSVSRPAEALWLPSGTLGHPLPPFPVCDHTESSRHG